METGIPEDNTQLAEVPHDPELALAQEERRRFVRSRAIRVFVVVGAVAVLFSVLSTGTAAAIALMISSITFFVIPIVILLAPFVGKLLGSARVRLARRRLGPASARVDLRHLPVTVRPLVDDARVLLLSIDDALAQARDIERLLWEWVHKVEALPAYDQAWLESAGAQAGPLRAALDRASDEDRQGAGVGREGWRQATQLALEQWVERCEAPRQQGYR